TSMFRTVTSTSVAPFSTSSRDGEGTRSGSRTPPTLRAEADAGLRATPAAAAHAQHVCHLPALTRRAPQRGTLGSRVVFVKAGAKADTAPCASSRSCDRHPARGSVDSHVSEDGHGDHRGDHDHLP